MMRAEAALAGPFHVAAAWLQCEGSTALSVQSAGGDRQA